MKKINPKQLRPAAWLAATTGLTLAALVILFILQRLVFALIYHSEINGSFADIIRALWAALPMDVSTAGYFTAFPLVIDFIYLWCRGKWAARVIDIYFALTSVLLAVIFVVDIALYGYWGFRLDTTPLFYFTSSPSSAMASLTVWQMTGGSLAILVTAALVFGLLSVTGRLVCPAADTCRPWRVTAVWVALCALLAVMIRGSVTVSTMNPSRVYFSDNQRLNHLALNPVFSFMYSASHQENFGIRFRYFDGDQIARTIRQLECHTSLIHRPDSADDSSSDSLTLSRKHTDSLTLQAERPDIYVIILESFSNHLLPSLGGEAIATGLDSIATEGVVWANFYASGFRTDRGIPAILSAFPSPPTSSVMKYVKKADKLPSLAAELHRQGAYEASYYYGGDANFTNLLAYLHSGGFAKIISDSDFSIREKASKWGAHDDVLMRRVLADVRNLPAGAPPQLAVVQTSSSHEPFEVPYSNPRFASNAKANAFAFTDSVVTDFVNRLQLTRRGRNSLVILVPDHWGAYPERRNLPDIFARHRVPLIMTGGALRQRGLRFDTPGSQTDIAATLLRLLGMDASAFPASHDLLNPQAPHYAWMSDNDEIALICDKGMASYNIAADRSVISETAPGLTDCAKAILQSLYDTLQSL